MLSGTPGSGKKTLAHALLRHMGEDGAALDEEESGALGQPKQAALINNQKCIIKCDDIYPEEEEDDSESGPLLASQRGGGLKRSPLKRGGGGPKLRKKENIFDKAAAKQKGLAKAKIVKQEGPSQEEEDQFPTGYIVVFDIGELTSFKEAERKLDELCGGGPQNFVVLAGNKTDKSRRYRKVTYEEGLKLSQKYPDIDYIETSAKLYQKVDKVFLTVVKKVQNSVAFSEPEANALEENGGKSHGKKKSDVEEIHESDDPPQEDSGDGSSKSNFCYDNCCCKCCPKPFRRCGKKCGKACAVM